MRAMRRYGGAFLAGGALLAAILTLPGCSSTGGGGFTLLPTGHRLMTSTKEVRDAAPTDVDLPRELHKAVLPSYVLQSGDVLLVEPTNLESTLRFPVDQPIMPDGTIDLGRFGRLVVSGKTVEQVEADVERAVKAEEKEAADINVRLITAQSAVYYVQGAVNSPGSFPLIGRETVLDGILAAGGLNGKASPCNIILSRPTDPHGCRVVLPICYGYIVQLGDTSTNYQLMPGDRIYVASRTLCEKLLPWRANKGCELCNCHQCACPDGGESNFPSGPEMVTEELPVAPLPAEEPKDKTKEKTSSDSDVPQEPEAGITSMPRLRRATRAAVSVKE